MTYTKQKIAGKIEIKNGEVTTIITDISDSFDIHFGRDSELTLIGFMNESLDEKTFNFHFENENSNLKCIIFNIGKNGQKFEFDSLLNHLVPNTNAELNIRSVLFDNAKVNTTDMIYIKEGAKKTNSDLNHNSLLLSEKASVRTIPSLEIMNDDVKAGHGATIGSVNDDLLFYLENRGIDKETGKKLLISAFLEAELENIENEELREYVRDQLVIEN